MSPLTFVLKSFFISFAISFVLGAISGFIVDILIPPHPHQIFSAWMAMAIIASFVGIIIALSVALYMVLKDKMDLKKLLITSTSGAFVMMVIALIWFLG